MKTVLRIAVGGILIAVLFASLSGQNVQTSEDVKIIQNKKKPDSPEATPTKMTLELEVVIGESDDPDKAFSQLTSFVVDDEGTIYALDFKDKKIKVFDESGEFLYVFGEEGQGPGELQMPAGIFLTPDNQLVINDGATRKMAYFTKQGKYIKDISYATKSLALVTLLMDSQGNFMGREMKLEGQEMFFEIGKFDADAPAFAAPFAAHPALKNTVGSDLQLFQPFQKFRAEQCTVRVCFGRHSLIRGIIH